MANHPNRNRKYMVCVQGWHNIGMGWEPTPIDLDGDYGGGEMTRAEANALTSARNVHTTSVTVHDDYGEPLAMAGRGETNLHWF